MKVKIIEKRPQTILIKFIESGRIVEYSYMFFRKRCDLGLFEIVNQDQVETIRKI